MKTLHVQTASSSYPVFNGQGIRKEVSEILNTLDEPITQNMIVTAEEIDRLYCEKMLHMLKAH
ncbi:hypothetical protein [Bacillus spizizenii]|uniref:hypothetical protein n=1 Tax=Bacillus spizizenii TaxID=96241 RepID=UPI00284F3A24|nr:hypothetical protein [Bacillus spizizenii]MDR4204828.1 hypothetical protein [Bacillus spizizenii ATCC 6633 = JCM 2499]